MDRLRVALISYDFGEYGVRLASGLAQHAEILLAMPDRLVEPHAAKLNHAVKLFSFPDARIRQAGKQWRTIRAIFEKVREFRPDVLHYQGVHLWFDLALPWFRRYPLVLTVHDFRKHPGDQRFQQTPFWIEMFARRRADQLIVHSQQVRDLMVREWPGSAGRVAVIPHIQIGEHSSSAEIPEEENLVLFFGRIWEYKGLEYLIRAEPEISARVKNVRILIAGQGEDFERYRRMMKNPERFLVDNQYISEERATEYFERAAVVVLPYIEASQSGVIPLAYSAGKPVVATTVGGLPEMVEHGRTGLLVPPRDVPRLADAVVRLLLDRKLRHEMGICGKKKMEAECSAERVAQKTLDVYRRAVEGTAQAHNATVARDASAAMPRTGGGN